MMIVKIHRTRDKRKIITVCDEELLGKKLEENDTQLDLSSDFYKGEIMSDEDLEKEIKAFYLINIAGNKSINFFLNKKLVSKKHIIYIKKIPYTQCMMV